MDKAGEMLDDAAERAQALRGDAKDGSLRLKARPPAWPMTRKIRLPASPTDLRSRAAQATSYGRR